MEITHRPGGCLNCTREKLERAEAELASARKMHEAWGTTSTRRDLDIARYKVRDARFALNEASK